MWLLAISVWARPGRRRRAKPTSSAGNASPYRSATRRWPKSSNGSNSRRDITSSIIATPCRGIGGISFSKADAPVREVLDEALRGTRLEYSIDDDTIVIRARSGGGNASAPQKAPDKVVSGRVTDTAGAPLVGVNILIQGTATGVVSGSDGGFSIRMPEGRDNLIFSYIGYVSQTLPSAQTRLVRLVQDEQEIENVVVTGIFTRKKESYTGSATTITSASCPRE